MPFYLSIIYLNKAVIVILRNGGRGLVTDLINRIVQVLRGDLYWFRISAQDAELMEPVELWDEG